MNKFKIIVFFQMFLSSAHRKCSLQSFELYFPSRFFILLSRCRGPRFGWAQIRHESVECGTATVAGQDSLVTNLVSVSNTATIQI